MQVRYSYLLLTVAGSALIQACSSAGTKINFKDPVAVSQTYMEALTAGQVDIVKKTQHNIGLLSNREFNEYLEDYVQDRYEEFQTQNGIANITIAGQKIQDEEAQVSFCLKTGNEPSGDPNEMQSAYRFFDIGYDVSLIKVKSKWKVLEASNLFGMENCQ